MSKVAPSPTQTWRWKGIALGSLALLGLIFWFSFSGGLATAISKIPGFTPDPETLAKKAQQEFMDRDYDQAEADLDRLNQLRAPDPLDWMLRAQLLMRKDRIDEALAALAKVPDDHMMGKQARLQAGQLELRRSHYIPAEAAFVHALKIDPTLVQARRELVYIYGMQLRRPELNANFRALSEISPLNYSEVFLWCLSRGVTWESTEIVETLKKCLEVDPTDRWARLGMAEGLREMARLDDAEEALKALPESDALARATKVKIALDRGDDQAADDLLAAGAADNLDLALLRGRFALARGNGPEAVRQFRIAYDQAPTLREAVLGLGQALKTTGDLVAAAPLLEEASKHERLGALIQRASAEKNRDDPVLMRDLGAACAAIGRFPESRAWYNLAISRDPLDTKAQQGLARVKELEAKAREKAASR